MNPNHLIRSCFLPGRSGTRKIHRLIGFGSLFFIAWWPINPSAAASELEMARSELPDLTALPFEDLIHVKVTTVSKKTEPLFDASSAVYVITGDDIRRSGYTSIPDALRLAPGLDVARIGSAQWAITSRGFNGLYANKLLVLMDGRTVYSPLNAGVNWDTVDTMLDDVDRIEVVRGPGGVLWGANAVNGVINIITKSAKETQGFYAEAGGGTLERAFGGIRYGGSEGDLFYRVYAKYFDRASFEMVNGQSADDGWQKGQGGFRLDWEPAGPNLMTVQGDFYGGTESVGDSDFDLFGGNLMGRWTHEYESDAQSKLQIYYDRFTRDQSALFDIETMDVDLQHRLALGERQEIIFGGGYRLIHDNLESSPRTVFTPQSRTVSLPNIFLQDEISLMPELLALKLGAKVEHDYFSGWEIQPNARLLWAPQSNHTFWASVSRAVKTPSRSQHDVRSDFLTIPGPTNTVYAADMRGRIESEEVLAYELGYRVQPVEHLSLDLATFYNVYHNFVTFEPYASFVETSPPPAHLVYPFEALNKAQGETYGAELSVRWQATDWWRLDANYTYLQIQMHAPHSREPTAEAAEGESPENQVSLRSAMNLPQNLQLDWIIRYVDSLPTFDVPSYTTMDVRLAWNPSPNWEISVVGQNLFQKNHLEFGAVQTVLQSNAEVPRGFYGKISCRF